MRTCSGRQEPRFGESERTGVALGELTVVDEFGIAKFPSPVGLPPPTELFVDLSHRQPREVGLGKADLMVRATTREGCERERGRRD